MLTSILGRYCRLNCSGHRCIETRSMRSLSSRSSRLTAALVFAGLLILLRWSSILHAAEERVADPKELPRFPPVAAGDAMNTFQLRKGFRLELVAAEPLVTDPIALAFDEDGGLFVVEMNDYPERGEQLIGQVKRLEDTDGDGRFDKATVFAKDLRWPSAIHCYGGGVFVGAAPDLLYYQGFNDDGRQFLCRQHRHIMTQLFDRRYADRNPYYTMPDPTVDIAVDGPMAALYRISPEEPWRVLRSKWRLEALENGIEAGGRAS